MNTYTTLNDAVQAEIVDPIEATGEVKDARAEYDIEKIAERVLGDHAEGYACLVEADEFWQIVAANAR